MKRKSRHDPELGEGGLELNPHAPQRTHFLYRYRQIATTCMFRVRCGHLLKPKCVAAEELWRNLCCCCTVRLPCRAARGGETDDGGLLEDLHFGLRRELNVPPVVLLVLGAGDWRLCGEKRK